MFKMLLEKFITLRLIKIFGFSYKCQTKMKLKLKFNIGMEYLGAMFNANINFQMGFVAQFPNTEIFNNKEASPRDMKHTPHW